LFAFVDLGLREILAQELGNHILPASEIVFRERI